MTDQPDRENLQADNELARSIAAEFDKMGPVDKELRIGIPGHTVVAQRFRALRLDHSTLEEVQTPDGLGFHAETRVFFLFEVMPPPGSAIGYQERHGKAADGG